MEQLAGLFPEQKSETHLSILCRSSLQQHRISLQSNNISSHILLNDVCKRNSELLTTRAVDDIIKSAKNLAKGTDFNKLTWRSSLSFEDPKLLFEKSIPPCSSCENYTESSHLDYLKTNECRCDLPIKNTTRKSPDDKHLFVKTLKDSSSSQESKSGESIPHFKKFGPKKRAQSLKKIKARDNEDNTAKIQKLSTVKKQNPAYIPQSIDPYIQEDEYRSSKKIALQNDFEYLPGPCQEDEDKSHKSNVAKITFKTAKEQLLASNPAAKRTLGASRKAQGKFVSPMIGAQDKQENDPMAQQCSDERLRNIDPKMIELIENEIIDKGTPVEWSDIAGLESAKLVIQEAVVWPLLRPELFTGLRAPPRGILLFGPPGTGKTLIGKCVAAQCRATFFSISASSLTSKWIGDGEKMVRALFAVARCHQPAVIFIDEIDSLLTQRSDSEHEATRRIKTEFLVQFDGAATSEDDRLLIVGATNRPQELDEAARRRLVKRLYIPLPDVEARKQIISNLLRHESHSLAPEQVSEVAGLAEGYSGADMRALCSEAAMGPIRNVPLHLIATIERDHVRPVSFADFRSALSRVRPSVSQDDLGQYVRWNDTYGQGF